MSRLPVRVRLTLAFAGVMAVVLGATGLFVHVRLGDELDATIEQGLRSRAALVEAGSGVRESGTLTERGENLAQIVDASGAIVDETPTLGGRPLLTREELQRARRGTIIVDRERPPGSDDPTRLLATPADGNVLVVGAPVDDRNDALASLARLLLVGGAVALLLASLAGYGVAAAALRPVERMRRRAADIQAAEPGARLPVGPARDEIGRLGETLNAMLARLEAAFARERAFVADASHELRSPLAILKAELELALRAGRSREELEAALRSAADETDRLVQLAEDLLVIARVDQGRLPIRPATVDAGEALTAVRERFAARADLDAASNGRVALVADPVRLQQALGNLVDNALRHGGGHIELAAEPAGANIELHVRDDGPGFPEGFIDDAFERFTRGDPARGRGGAGLGLAIVAAIAHAHGGTAGARNLPGGGADVWISLPCAS
jgi:two-component system OmpR family sensor kinase